MQGAAGLRAGGSRQDASGRLSGVPSHGAGSLCHQRVDGDGKIARGWGCRLWHAGTAPKSAQAVRGAADVQAHHTQRPASLALAQNQYSAQPLRQYGNPLTKIIAPPLALSPYARLGGTISLRRPPTCTGTRGWVGGRQPTISVALALLAVTAHPSFRLFKGESTHRQGATQPAAGRCRQATLPHRVKCSAPCPKEQAEKEQGRLGAHDGAHPPTRMPRTPRSSPLRVPPAPRAPTSKPSGVPPVTPMPCLQQSINQLHLMSTEPAGS